MTKKACDCKYNKKLLAVFEEVSDLPADDFEEMELVLEHCPLFSSMVDAVQDKEFDPQMVMTDAVRLGYKAGKRMNEIENLEAMVGIGKKYRRKKR